MKNINCAIALLIAVFSGLMLSCSESSERSPTAYVIPEVTAVDNINIFGVSQKGPFVNGSSVTVQELEGTTLAQTGKSFKGKIANDRGEFSISSVSLVSQYALLEANGYYRNEVTGNKSTSTITLNAITDLSSRSSVNINILTHLEYSRVLFLIDSDSINMAAAKVQAEGEIMKAFGIDSISSLSEDLSIFSNGSSNAALLALSVLFQGNKTEAELSEVLANFSNDIEEDGSWDDEQTKASMADWAADADLSGIKTNILSWGVSDTLPDFESAVNRFWGRQYGLGDCGLENALEVKQDTNSYSSKKGMFFLCENSLWREASSLEYDNYGNTCAQNGNIQEGTVEHLLYTCDSSLFRLISDLEDTLNKGCTNYNINDSAVYDANVYICSDSGWYLASLIEYRTLGLVCAEDGSFQKSLTDTAFSYVCDDGLFREPSLLETEIVFSSFVGKGCTTYNVFEESAKYIDENGIYQGSYLCSASNGEWYKLIYRDSITDVRDNEVYTTVGIGTQLWMAENLNYVTDNSWCYNDSTGYCLTYGRLYSWTVAANNENGDTIHGICPEGWHLPSAEEWNTLSEYVTEQLSDQGVDNTIYNIGTTLKSIDYWKFYELINEDGSKDTSASSFDTFGFDARGAGEVQPPSTFLSLREKCYFWSSTNSDDDTAKAKGRSLTWGMSEESAVFDEQDINKSNGISVRCLKDQ
jgi:uncharacterized protein (TIGR02145 family)